MERICRGCSESFEGWSNAIHCSVCRPIESNHRSLRTKMTDERVSKEDPLWSFRFYRSLVFGAECSYCSSSLPKDGHGLDRADNSRFHEASNVVPCCWTCNSLKGARFSYEEMMLLSPGLKQIKRLRSDKAL